MSTRIMFGLVMLTGLSIGRGEVVIELVPTESAPYLPGQELTVDVWLHSEVSFDAYLAVVQLDFSDSHTALVLSPTFAFDLSAIPEPRPGDYAVIAELPVPVVWVVHDGPIFPENMLPLPAGGSLHIGHADLALPVTPGVYRLDVLNADEPSDTLGARIDTALVADAPQWRPYTGEITGGTFDFRVEGPVPAVSEWGLVILSLFVLTAGSLVLSRRPRTAT